MTPAPDNKALLAALQARQGHGYDAGAANAPAVPPTAPGAPPPEVANPALLGRMGALPPPGIDPAAAPAPPFPMGHPQQPEPSAAPPMRQPDPMEMQAILRALQQRQAQNAPPTPAPDARA